MPHSLAKRPAHLGLDATATVEPEFTGGMDWYEAYERRHESDGKEGRLVAQHTFTESWTSWEVHPAGEELVICTAGSMTLVQEMDGRHVRQRLEAGDYAINPRGVWHTADVEDSATAVFITPGLGTHHRPR